MKTSRIGRALPAQDLEIVRPNVQKHGSLSDPLGEDAASYATVAVRGGRSEEPGLANAFVYMPTMLDTQRFDTPLVQEAMFDRVLSFETSDEETNALTRANATEFVLAPPC